MAIDLILSSETEATLTDNQLDTNFTDIQTAVNALSPITSTSFNTQLVLRSNKGTTLTNDELDSNFVYLDSRSNGIQLQFDELIDVTLPARYAQALAISQTKQPLNAKLTSLSANSSTGWLSLDGNTITARVIEAGSENIVVSNVDGVDGNPSIDIGITVVTLTGAQTLTNKTIYGDVNTVRNISLTESVTGVLPRSMGGTEATTAAGARSSLEAMRAPGGTGFVIKTDADEATTRQIEVYGAGLSIINPDGIAGNPVIVSNDTPNNEINTIVARDGSGNFSANLITANLIGDITGNAATVTNGVYDNQSYSNPSWITALAGTKVTGIPNSSLDNHTVTFHQNGNDTTINLGGTINLEDSDSANTAYAVVKRDGAGNFSANTITANLAGNATTAGSATTALLATRLRNPRLINGVSFSGMSDITVADDTKVPVAGGTMTGFLSLHASPTEASHASTKAYVDAGRLTIENGTFILDTQEVPYYDLYPPVNNTMDNLKGFLPAFGSSYGSTPTYSTNLIIAIDTSGSASSSSIYNGTTYTHAWQAGVAAAKSLVDYYAARGPTTVCISRVSNTNTGVYRWTSSAEADNILDELKTFTGGTSGTLLNAFSNRPSNAAQTIVYFMSDMNHDLKNGTAFGGSEAAWKSFLNTNKIVSYALCVDNSGSASYGNEYAWDGRTATQLNAFRTQVIEDIPKAQSYGIYNTSSIIWTALSDRIRVELSDESDVSGVSINWLSIWGQ